MYEGILYLVLLLSLFDFAIDIGESKPLDDDTAPDVESEKTTESVTDYDDLDVKKSTTTSGESDTATLMDDQESEFASVICPHFVNASRLDTEAMADVWQTAYYREPHRVPCFRMQIRRLSSEEKSRYSQLYGDFNDRVVWEDVGLEVRARGDGGGGGGGGGGGARRRHFLQGCERGRGVLENIILEQHDNSTAVTLVEETADQWRVAGDVLLVRDCDSGALVAFSRVPHQPRLAELAAAADGFGALAGGAWACRDKRRAADGEFDTFGDVVLFE